MDSRERMVRRPNRRGFSMMEIIVAAGLLGVVVLVTVPSLRWVSAGRRDAAQRQLASQELANVMERLLARESSALTPEGVATEELSAEAKAHLPGGALKVAVTVTDDSPPSKRVTAELRWNDATGQSMVPIRLTAWKYQREEKSK
ncbi:MAG: prepilin-type N-terminal cleavage/methylation domain-containing protein [Planctomycetales bacterium]|nr:prepilin-type N-terminal cleavage/methylation domain-containing protein [Planctomycetales bacterium]